MINGNLKNSYINFIDSESNTGEQFHLFIDSNFINYSSNYKDLSSNKQINSKISNYRKLFDVAELDLEGKNLTPIDSNIKNNIINFNNVNASTNSNLNYSNQENNAPSVSNNQNIDYHGVHPINYEGNEVEYGWDVNLGIGIKFGK